MKFYKISETLNYKKIKPIYYSNNNRTYNNLYNDYIIRNNKKEDMKVNNLYNESTLYPYTPLINKSGYITFSPNNSGNFTPYTTRYDFYRKTNPDIKNAFLSENFPLERNLLTENNLYNNKNYNPNNFGRYNNLHYDFNNSYIQDYPNNNILNNKNKKYGYPSTRNLNRTDNPINNHKNKNIYSNKDNEINNQISGYLNNFQNNKTRMNNFNSMNNTNNDLYPKKRNKSNINISRGSNYDIINQRKTQFNNNHQNQSLNNTNFKRSKELDRYFNKNNNHKNIKLDNNRLNYTINSNNKNRNVKNNSKSKNNNNEDDKNSKIIYNDSRDYFYSFNKENKKRNNNKDLSKKNSNLSLNPSSLGVDHMKTSYTNKPIISNTINGVTSNINSASERILDTQYHFLNGLKMASGEVNEYFYDFNNGKKSIKEQNDDTQSLQSLSDSKMLELANKYISDEDNSVENYQMNNIIYNKKKYKIK